MIQDALTEVMKMCPPMKLKVVVDEIIPVMAGRNKELLGIADNVLRALGTELEEKGLKLSMTEGGKEGKTKVVASCSKKIGAGLANGAET